MRPEGKAFIGPAVGGKRPYVTSAFVKEALDRGAEQFQWEKRKAQPKRSGTKARGIGVATSCFVGGSIGFDGLFRDQAGWQALYTVRHRQPRHRVGERFPSRDRRDAGRPLGKVRDHLGKHGKNLPWTCPSGGSQTIHAMTRSAYAVAMDARKSCRRSRPRISAAAPIITRSRTNASSAKAAARA